MITIQFTAEEINNILWFLSRLPFIEVNNTIQLIYERAQAKEEVKE
tara:strand:- start:557 stop:694 length:138 start_codon:yes stop_codon:yes gene_type:complete